MKHEVAPKSIPQEMVSMRPKTPYSSAQELITMTRQLYALEDGDCGIKEVSYENGVRIFDKDGSRYILECGNGIDAKLQRRTEKGNGRELQISTDLLFISLDHQNKEAFIVYLSVTLANGQTASNAFADNEAVSRIEAMLEPFYSKGEE